MALEKYYCLFDVIRSFNNYFTPDSSLFSDYCLWFLERGFHILNTCYCKRTETLENVSLGPEITRALCVFDKPFDKGNPHFFEDVKVCIVLTNEDNLDLEISSCKDEGFFYGYLWDKKSEEVTPLGYLGEPANE